MDSSPITQGAANSFLPKKESRTDMDRDVVVVEVVARRVRRSKAVEEEEVVKALVEPRTDAKTSSE